MPAVVRLEVLGAGRRALIGAGLGLGIALVFLALRKTDAFSRLEQQAVDARTRLYLDDRAPDDRIVLAVVGEEDVAEMRTFGAEWPWTEEWLQYLPRTLEAAGAAGLLLDFLYLDRGWDLEELGTSSEEESLLHATQREHVEMFARALASFGKAGAALTFAQKSPYGFAGRVAVARSRAGLFEGDATSLPSPIEASEVNLSIRALLEGVRHVGFADMVSDLDGVVRRVALVRPWDGVVLPSLPSVGAALLAGEAPRVAGRGACFGAACQRLDREGTFHLRFRRPHVGSYVSINPVKLLQAGYRLAAENEPLPQDLVDRLRGRLVVWGANILGHDDIVPTPIDAHMPGPELLALAVDDLLHGAGRVRVEPPVDAFALLGSSALLGLLLLGSRRRLLPFLALPGIAAAFLAVALWAFRSEARIFDLATPLLSLVFVALGAGLFRLLTEGRRNRWLETTFSRYLAPDVIEALKADPSRLALGGRRREITILFSDVAGFTSLSERLPGEDVVKLLNRYLTDQSAELMRERGVIDKFQGDAIMAFFGDPLDMPDHALRACRAALAGRRGLGRLQPLLDTLGVDGFHVRIGLNTGSALVGNMGSDMRFDYTCMGDAVNLASRLEGANKHFGSTILLGAATYEAVAAHVLAKPLGELVVVGRKEAVPVFELVAMVEQATPAERAHVEAFRRAYEKLRSGLSGEARVALEEARAQAPDDGPTEWLDGLIAEYEQKTNNETWDGRVVLHSK